jgi:DNA-binding transcriptional regulator YiaG
MMINQHGGTGALSRVVGQFDARDFGAPFKILLNNAVKATFDENGELLDYTIPDPDGLLRTVVVARVLNNRKLSGADIKFLRKAVGVKQKDAARSIEMSAEHMSRCENGSLPMSPGSEKLLRIFLFKTAIKHHKFKECEAKRKLEKALDQLFDVLTPRSSIHSGEEEELVLSFHRSVSSASTDKKAANDTHEDAAWQDDCELEAA